MQKTPVFMIPAALGIMSLILISFSSAAVWDPEQQLTVSDYDEYTGAAGQRNVVVDSQGRIHVVWFVEDYLLPNPFQIYYKRYNPGSGWTPDTCLTPDLMAQNIYNRYPSITADAQGNLHVVWCAGLTASALGTLYYKRCTPSVSGNGGWQDTAQSIGPGSGADSVYTPDIACSSNGHVHVVWSRKNTSFLGIRYRESSDGGNTWLNEISIFDTTASGGPQNNPTVACAPNNSVHIAWSGKDYWGGAFHLYYRKRIGVTWFAREGVVMSSADQYLPSIAISPVTGNPHIVWRRYFSLSAYEIVHTYWDNVWQPVQVISGTVDTTQNNPQLAFTPDGSAHAVWHGTSPVSPGIRQIRYNVRNPAGAWGTAFDLTAASVRQRDCPSIASQGHDLQVVWQDDRGTYQNLYFRHGFASFHDVGCQVILSPSGLVDSGTVLIPACSLKNYDTTAESYTVRMKIGNGYNETALVDDHLPGTVRYVTFPSWTALPRGVLAVSCSTELSSDGDRTNDRLTGTVSVRVVDMVLTSIVRPIEIEAPGTIPVIARMLNAGSVNTDCQIRVIITDSLGGEVYNQYQDYTAIPPGDSVQAQLSDWTAGVPGVYYARARVSATGDQNPGNDSLTRYVTVEAVGIEESRISMPVSFEFTGASPNPFADRTTLSYTLPLASRVHLRVYSATGRLLRVLLSGVRPAGRHAFFWDGCDEQQRLLNRGVYYFRFESGNFRSIKKFIKLE